MKKNLSLAVVGAGMGGLAVAATLRRVGIEVQVYEQTARFARIGAGIRMMPNLMKVLRGVGIEEQLRKTRTLKAPTSATRLTGMRDERGGDTSWLDGYDAWNANLDQPAAHPQMQAA